MKPNTLTIASLLSIILLPFHIGGDVALGFDRGGPGLVFVVVPILIGVLAGRWLDREFNSGLFWTGPLLMLGLALGCWSAWKWMVSA